MKKLNIYFKEFRWKNLLTVIGILLSIFLLRNYFHLAVYKYIIARYNIDKIRSDLNLDIFFILILVYCIAWLIYLRWRKLIPGINSCVNIILFSLFYLIVIRYSGAYFFEHIESCPFLKYTDILFFLFLFIISKFQYYHPLESGEPIFGFFEDNFNPSKNIDILSRKNFANKVGLKILGTNTTSKAFVIAINSPWGFGKTGFLLLLEEFFSNKDYNDFNNTAIKSSALLNGNDINRLFARNQNTVVIRYNPWKNFDEKKIIQNFFDELAYAIKKYDYQLSKRVKIYGQRLVKLDDTIVSKIFDTAIDSFEKIPTLSDLFDEINKKIYRIQKRIIVFIDDLDRLNGDELIDVLKLIRNTANFNNVFFIVAYDHNYVLNTIDKKDLISSKEEYLQKIVQLELTLPIFNKSILIKYLEDCFHEYKSQQFGFDKIDLALKEILSVNLPFKVNESKEGDIPDVLDMIYQSERKDYSLLYNVFNNLRDIIRFANSFKVSFESIGQYTDVYEIILLEILKTKYLSIYQLISNKRFLIIVDENYQFNYDEFERFCTDASLREINVRFTEKEIIREIINRIFNPPRKTFFRSIKHPLYFDIYFTYQAPNLFQLENFESALKSDNIDQVISLIENSVRDDTYDDLRNFIESQFDFASKGSFEIILKTLFYISKFDLNNSDTTLFQIKKIIQNESVIQSIYLNKIDFLNFLLSIFMDERYDKRTRIEIAGDKLYEIVNNKNDKIDQQHNELKIKLQNIILEIFKEKIKEYKIFNPEIYSFYLKNLEDIETGSRKIVITQQANDVMRDFIVLHKIEYFKRYFLRYYPGPSFNGQYFNLDPFLPHYFYNDWNKIKFELNSIEVIEDFNKAKQGSEYHSYLNFLTDKFSTGNLEKFLEEDDLKIALVGKFIGDNDYRRRS